MSSPRVLVVDDEADIRALIQEILSEEGYGVTVAAEIAYDPTATSFDAEAAEVAAAGVDSVAIITFGEGAALLQAMIDNLAVALEEHQGRAGGRGRGRAPCLCRSRPSTIS